MRARFLTEAELRALKASLGNDWLLFEVAIESGLRIGDVLKIRPSDLRGDYLDYIAEKTGKSGTIKLKRATARALINNARGAVWCFPSPKDREKHLTRQAAWARLKKAAERAQVDITGVSPHSFRKSFAVKLFAESDLETVRKALQHTDAHTTEIYALADWSTGKNANLPLLRGDLPFIISKCVEAVKKRLD